MSGTSNQAQPYSPNHDIKMAPSSYPEFSPTVNTPLPSTSGVHHVDPGINYRTTIKREKGCPDSEELPVKRQLTHQYMDLEYFLSDLTPTNDNSNNPFIETNRHPPFQNDVSTPAPDFVLGYVPENDSSFPDEFLKQLLDNIEPEQLTDLTNLVADGDLWMERVSNPNVNQPIQHDHANLQQNVAQPGIFNNFNQNLPVYNINFDLPQSIERVSEDLSKMNFQYKL